MALRVRPAALSRDGAQREDAAQVLRVPELVLSACIDGEDPEDVLEAVPASATSSTGKGAARGGAGRGP